MAVVRYYEEAKNPLGGVLPGVPLRDLEEDEFDALPEYIQKSIDQSEYFRKTKPADTRVSAAKKDGE